MTDNNEETRITGSPPSTTGTSSTFSLKSKVPSDSRQPSPLRQHPLPPGANIPQGEYETGRVICEVCGGGVSFRDEQSGGFTLKHWDTHRLTCTAAPSRIRRPSDPVIYTPESTAQALSSPQTKRRRAKRTEEERIEYLRADPYVAQFEAYRVLCASCDKWIRLRPNSTYCSIPWDAHRKSCLAKRTSSKNVDALEERNALFAKDPDVRKFDSERILCNLCDRWLSIKSDDHVAAVQTWLQHRASCQRTVYDLNNSTREQSTSQVERVLVKQEGDATPSQPSSSQAATQPATSAPSTSAPPSSSSSLIPEIPHPGSPSFLLDLSPVNYAAPHESRRRNAEQRAATLRADVLIREVEPNRVFCSLCQKWVQLRQDSSYCAYPWLQHRGKCLARYQRRAQKTAAIGETKARKYILPPTTAHYQQYERSSGAVHTHRDSDRDEPEEGVISGGRSNSGHQHKRPIHHPHPYHSTSASSIHAHPPRNVNMNVHGYGQAGPTHRSAAHPHPQLHPHVSGSISSRAATSGLPYPRPAWAHLEEEEEDEEVGEGEKDRQAEREDVDMDADGESDSSFAEEDRRSGGTSAGTNADSGFQQPLPVRRALPVGLADLDSPGGRKHFVFSSVSYLFSTTYEVSDDLTIADLLAYLNAAMPQDKHEDFDTSEVIRAAAALVQECQRGNWNGRGRFVFEGDLLRLVD